MAPAASSASAADPVSCPGASSPAEPGPAVAVTQRMVSAPIAAAIGRLTRNTARQPKATTSPPPSTGPTISELPAAPAQIPTAWARSRGAVKVCVRIARVAGISIAAPTPCTARKMISQPVVGAAAHSPDPAAKTATPAR